MTTKKSSKELKPKKDYELMKEKIQYFSRDLWEAPNFSKENSEKPYIVDFFDKDFYLARINLDENEISVKSESENHKSKLVKLAFRCKRKWKEEWITEFPSIEETPRGVSDLTKEERKSLLDSVNEVVKGYLPETSLFSLDIPNHFIHIKKGTGKEEDWEEKEAIATLNTDADFIYVKDMKYYDKMGTLSYHLNNKIGKSWKTKEGVGVVNK